MRPLARFAVPALDVIPQLRRAGRPQRAVRAAKLPRLEVLDEQVHLVGVRVARGEVGAEVAGQVLQPLVDRPLVLPEVGGVVGPVAALVAGVILDPVVPGGHVGPENVDVAGPEGLILSPAIIYNFSTVSSLQSYYWQPEGLLTHC